MVGAYKEDSTAVGINGDPIDGFGSDFGVVYVFTRTGTSWTQQAYVKASNSGTNDQFGISIAISGDTLAVGADYEGSNAIGMNGDQTNNNASNSGAVYVFK